MINVKDVTKKKSRLSVRKRSAYQAGKAVKKFAVLENGTMRLYDTVELEAADTEKTLAWKAFDMKTVNHIEAVTQVGAMDAETFNLTFEDKTTVECATASVQDCKNWVKALNQTKQREERAFGQASGASMMF